MGTPFTIILVVRRNLMATLAFHYPTDTFRFHTIFFIMYCMLIVQSQCVIVNP